jgi:hypothetical protein
MIQVVTEKEAFPFLRAVSWSATKELLSYVATRVRSSVEHPVWIPAQLCFFVGYLAQRADVGTGFPRKSPEPPCARCTGFPKLSPVRCTFGCDVANEIPFRP